MAEDKNKLNRLEDINRKIYSRDESLLKTRKEKPLSKFSYGVSTEWASSTPASTGQNRRKGLSVFKKFFIFSLIVFVGALGFALYKFGTGSNTFSAQNLEVDLSISPFVESAQEIDATVVITNKNTAAVEVSSLILEYQKGESLEGEDSSAVVERKTIDMGAIDSFSSASGSTRITLFGDQGGRRIVKAILEYRVSGSSAVFIKEAEREVLISTAPITITVEAPKDVHPGQEINLTLKIASNSATVSKNMLVKVLYPFGFQFKEASPEPFSGEGVWFLGDLAPGAQKTILIKGLALGDIGEEKIVRVLVGEQDKNNQSEIGVLYASGLSSLNLASPSLDLKLLIGGRDQEVYPVASLNRVQAEINWSNNLPTRMEDLEISARITGNALNENSITPQAGLYDHLEDKIIWNKFSLPALASVAPGDRGAVSFSFVPISTADGALLASPAVSIEVSIQGKKVNDDNTLEPVSNFDRTKTVKIISNLQVGAKALHASGPIPNSGPLPPQAGTETTYTIVWTVTNSNNDVDKAEVRAKLAPFAVKWLSRFEPAGEDVIFNETTKEVIWRLGRVTRGTGIGSDAREVSFQIGLEPFLSQVGTAPMLIDQTVLTGEDSFAGVALKNVRNSLDTRLLSDPLFKGGEELVTQ